MRYRLLKNINIEGLFCVGRKINPGKNPSLLQSWVWAP